MLIAHFDYTSVQDVSAVVAIAVGLIGVVALFMRLYYKARIENIERRNTDAFQEIQHQLESRGTTSSLTNVAYGMKDHYDAAVNLVGCATDEIFLMQRSSTLVLGPEEGWHEERNLYNMLFSKLNAGVQIWHVVNLEGMVDHLRRPGSKFPGIIDALNALPVENGVVVLRGPNRSFPVKVVPGKLEDKYIKMDRQARTLIVRGQDGGFYAGIVLDLGLTQCHFEMGGPLIRDFWRASQDFYHQCPPLELVELRKKLEPWLAPESI